MCVCVCKYTQPYFQSGAAWPPLCALPCSHRGACTIYCFSPCYSLRAQHFSSLFSPLYIPSISNNLSAHWAGALQPPFKARSCPLSLGCCARRGAGAMALQLGFEEPECCQDTKPDVEALGTTRCPRARQEAGCALRPGGAASRPRITLAPLLLEILGFPSA